MFTIFNLLVNCVYLCDPLVQIFSIARTVTDEHLLCPMPSVEIRNNFTDVGLNTMLSFRSSCDSVPDLSHARTSENKVVSCLHNLKAIIFGFN